MTEPPDFLKFHDYHSSVLNICGKYVAVKFLKAFESCWQRKLVFLSVILNIVPQG